MKRKIIATILAACMLVGSSTEAFAKTVVKSTEEQLASREVLTTKQDREIKLGEDGKPRVIITSDLEVDDMNSFIHESLFFNEIDLAGIVVSGSFCHFTGDGEHTQGEVMDHIQNREEGALEMKEFRAQPLDWLSNLWNNEYAEVYENLSKNADGYPTPEYLTSITKIGNVEFEGDVREDTEGSNLIKECILDDDERTLFVLNWGGFNTVARALLSIYDEYSDTKQWDEIYQKVCDKVIVQGTGQDYTFDDYIVEKYPDLVVASANCGYAGYSTAINGQSDAVYTFQADWLKENIKFDHGALMSIYKLVNDGQHLENEEDEYQFGETNTVYNKEYNDYDFIAEGDSGSIIGLFACGLRTFENGAFGSYAGRYSYTTASGEDAGYVSTLNGVVPGLYINPETDKIGKYNPYLLDFQLEWAARADWCVSSYEDCNHAPVVEMDEKDFTVKAGETVSFEAKVSDPDGDKLTSTWSTEQTGCVYNGKDSTIFNWTEDNAKASFTVPKDAEKGDCFILTLRVQDDADAVMTRYAQVMITVA